MKLISAFLVLLVLVVPLQGQDKVAAAAAAVQKGSFSEAVALIGEPASPMERYWLGRAQVELQRLDEAEAGFRQIIAADGANSAGYEGLARVYLVRKDYAAAKENAAKAVELDANSANANYALGLAYAYQQDFPNAITSLQKAVTIDDSNAYAHYQLGLLQYRQKKYDQTIIHFEKFLALKPDAPEAPQVKQILRTVRF